MSEIGVGLVGTGFVAEIHADAFARVPEATIRAVTSRTEAGARRFAEGKSIPRTYSDYRRLVEDKTVDIVCVACPNDLHRDVVIAAAEAGKHVICEKPLARTLAEADEMLVACREARVLLMYAEELCFAPKYVRAKNLAAEGALGRVYLVRHAEQHSGPHAEWFKDINRSGGGALMDMGCHGIEFFRWIYDRATIESVTCDLATLLHCDAPHADDHVFGTVKFAGNRLGHIDTSWAKPGGMDDRAEIVGSRGITYVDLLRGSSLVTFSEVGYGYAVEKAPSTRGWTYTMWEELWNYGFPQEMQHFVDCVLNGTEPLETGNDGRAVLEVIYGMYLAANRGERIMLPLELDADSAARPPIELWR